ncbi:MAG: sigma-70 family RNA polymerase sigma factor [Eubacterium sp.]|nr:sigma-70 family RNA polymerase sigma factor [Eubacterium sp.]
MDELYRENAKIVYYFLFSRCKDEALAEDLMQETFVRAMERIERFDGSCKMSTWLCQIAKHLLYQHWEKHRRETLQEPDEQCADAGNVEREVMQRMELEDVWERMKTLPQQTYRVMMLRIVSDLSYEQIGGMFGKSESWARVTYFRGKQQLLKAIEMEGIKDA